MATHGIFKGLSKACCSLIMVAVVCGTCMVARGQTTEDQTVQAAAMVLSETVAKPLGNVPAWMLSDCHGVAIIPNVIKGGFIVGARRGHGVLLIRDPDGTWHAPVFVTLTGGNIGWQAGVQASDIILVFKTSRSIQGILAGKLTLGGDASAAAGPVGRVAGVATDGQLQAEIYTYSRSRGLFAGVSIDGSVLRVDQIATGRYYGNPAPGQPLAIPPAALQLTHAVAAYAGQVAPTTAWQPATRTAEQFGSDRAELIQDQIFQLAPDLFQLLDAQWTEYLSLPLMPLVGEPANLAAIDEVIRRYDQVANDPRFSQLASRPEFRSVHGLLKDYRQALTPSSPVMELPPPPAPR